MEAATRVRKGKKAWLTRTSNALVTLLDETKHVGKDVKPSEIRTYITELDSRLVAFKDANDDVEFQMTDDEQLESFVTDTEKYIKTILKVRSDALECLDELTKPKVRAKSGSVSKGPDVSLTATSATKPQVRLPKIELPKFDGDVLQWYTFWDKFNALVDNTELPDISKFTYLESLLEGEAKGVTKGLAITERNYPIAKQLLQERFGRKEKIIFVHIQTLLKLSSNVSTSTLTQLYDELQTHLRSLEALGVDSRRFGVFLTPIVLACLPDDIRLEWARDSEGKESDLVYLLAFLQKEMHRHDRADLFVDKPATTVIKTSTASALATNASSSAKETSISCGICSKKHPTYRCWDLINASIADRREKVKSSKLCFRCLSKLHYAKNCRINCKRCGGKHHSILCEGNRQLSDSSQSSDSRHSSDGRQSSVKPQKPSGSTNSDTKSLRNQDQGDVSHVTHANIGQSVRAILPMAKVKVKGSRGEAEVNLLFDTGSDRTYVTSDLVKKIGPQFRRSECIGFTSFGGGSSSKKELRNVYSLQISSLMNSCSVEEVDAIEIPIICAPIQRPKVPTDVIDSFQNNGIVLSESQFVPGETAIDILVGVDAYWDLVKTGFRRHKDGIVAQETVFGWIISGSTKVQVPGSVFNCGISHQLFCESCVAESDVTKMWDLETVGVARDEKPPVNTVLENFEKSIKRVDGRYEVTLPKKPDFCPETLLDNRKFAIKQVGILTRRFDRDTTGLQQKYDSVFVEYENLGIIEEVPVEELITTNPVFYLPHHPVVRESRLSTKVRPVFNASWKGYNGISLNDCLETGPCLLPNLVEVLIRFRRWQVALTADCTKAFLQISVNPLDRDMHRFVWNFQNSLRTMRFTRVPFGNKSSPFLLNATIKHHLSSYPDSFAVEELKENLYVDDWLSGADSDAEVCDLFETGSSIMAEAGMTLAKCFSNSTCLVDKLGQESSDQVTDSSVKVLGMRWLSDVDCFAFDGVELKNDVELVRSKRTVLSFISRLFDPLGLLLPFTMSARILFQDIWKLNLDWDKPLPDEIWDRFMAWVLGIKVLLGWRVPRCYFPNTLWESVQSKLEIHVFCDASERAYGAVVFSRLQVSSDEFRTSFIVSKARVAPMKVQTIPRLELMAALVGARLLKFVLKALKLSSEVKYFCWSDSMVVIGWLKSGSQQKSQTKLPVFVANRVGEILDLTDSDNWFHVEGRENPADLITRGLSADSLVSSELWMKGPKWLSYGFPDVNQKGKVSVIPDDVRQENQTSQTLVSVSNKFQRVLPTERWSTFGKALRVTAFVLKFVNLLRNMIEIKISSEGLRDVVRVDTSSSSEIDSCTHQSDVVTGDGSSQSRDLIVSQDSSEKNALLIENKCIREGDLLSLKELTLAKLVLFKHTQKEHYLLEIQNLEKGECVPRTSSILRLSPFIDGDGLLRVKGRLQLSPLTYEEKHPIILPYCHLSLLLTRFQHVFLKHAGVESLVSNLRCSYWIVKGRRLAKTVKRYCVPCQKQDADACNRPPAPLPALRVQEAAAFTITGLDYAGPVYCADDPGSKKYILLCTCAVVRAVHLEITDSMSLPDFILAIRRFAARRGLPRVFFSDNAKTFIAAKFKLKEVFLHMCPTWKFIVPRSPWWGGWWERLVRSVKAALKKTLGNSCLTRIELETVLLEIEACVNSRPLTFVGDTVETANPLTPSHFLIGRSSSYHSEGCTFDDVEPVVSSGDLKDRALLQKHRLQQFWKVWSLDYLRNLPPAVSKFYNRGSLKVGSLVLIEEDHLRRLQWPIAVVTDLHPGVDGVVRTATLRTAKGTVSRAVQRLHCLEISENDHETLFGKPTELDSGSDGQIAEIVDLQENVPVEQPASVSIDGNDKVGNRLGTNDNVENEQSLSDSVQTGVDAGGSSVNSLPCDDSHSSDSVRRSRVSGRIIRPKVRMDL